MAVSSPLEPTIAAQVARGFPRGRSPIGKALLHQYMNAVANICRFKKIDNCIAKKRKKTKKKVRKAILRKVERRRWLMRERITAKGAERPKATIFDELKF